jgi:hypothetical protein
MVMERGGKEGGREGEGESEGGGGREEAKGKEKLTKGREVHWWLLLYTRSMHTGGGGGGGGCDHKGVGFDFVPQEIYYHIKCFFFVIKYFCSERFRFPNYGIQKKNHGSCCLFCCREHLGLLPEQHVGNDSTDAASRLDVQDPASDRFYNTWCSIARSNMEIYEKVSVEQSSCNGCGVYVGELRI